MLHSRLAAIIILLLLFQLGFSFYFNSEIINQNQKFSSATIMVDQLEKSNQLLENQYTQAISLSAITQTSTSSAHIVNKSLDLNQKIRVQP